MTGHLEVSRPPVAQKNIITLIGRQSYATLTLLLLFGSLLLSTVWVTWTPLVEVDETRYAEATREMIASGDWIIPHYNYMPRYQKPILYYWIQSVARLTLGSHEWALRLPSALIGIALTLLLHTFLRRELLCWAGGDGESGDPAHRLLSITHPSGIFLCSTGLTCQVVTSSHE